MRLRAIERVISKHALAVAWKWMTRALASNSLQYLCLNISRAYRCSDIAMDGVELKPAYAVLLLPLLGS